MNAALLRYATDNALSFAAGSVLGGAVVTSSTGSSYIRPPIGDAVVSRASVVHAGKTQGVCRCDVFVVRESEERLCGTAQGTFVVLPGT